MSKSMVMRCPRCGKQHNSLETFPLTNIDSPLPWDEGPDPNSQQYAFCPITGQPVILRSALVKVKSQLLKGLDEMLTELFANA